MKEYRAVEGENYLGLIVPAMLVLGGFRRDHPEILEELLKNVYESNKFRNSSTLLCVWSGLMIWSLGPQYSLYIANRLDKEKFLNPNIIPPDYIQGSLIHRIFMVWLNWNNPLAFDKALEHPLYAITPTFVGDEELPSTRDWLNYSDIKLRSPKFWNEENKFHTTSDIVKSLYEQRLEKTDLSERYRSIIFDWEVYPVAYGYGVLRGYLKSFWTYRDRLEWKKPWAWLWRAPYGRIFFKDGTRTVLGVMAFKTLIDYIMKKELPQKYVDEVTAPLPKQSTVSSGTYVLTAIASYFILAFAPFSFLPTLIRPFRNDMRVQTERPIELVDAVNKAKANPHELALFDGDFVPVYIPPQWAKDGPEMKQLEKEKTRYLRVAEKARLKRIQLHDEEAMKHRYEYLTPYELKEAKHTDSVLAKIRRHEERQKKAEAAAALKDKK
eukprot:TRINITY_DN2148_c0_g2_i4.p1 TRINITY_DN2148_c0_g2~~TRINITY_DN2148_c0_g2_i4.p1  ORF type:complete len:438 (-),score=122.01 TRINITY_DN2148_c0_g2_i4:23-1336(-)